MEFKEVKIEIYVPEEYITELRNELNNVNACKVGYYDNVISITDVRGYWRPLKDATPFQGEIGEICEGRECKMELRCRSQYVKKALEVIRKIHPYEEPLINVIPILNELFE
ncbi:divalent cation tolerance protein CutA [Clostridium ihumii]|uniref:divalent cation tolerance protein CutA n=1 Tax=Clostridium ihumii TaxID=1470356 RepID=UPI0005557620|nr:divalent cation tolerance protein CutA [Clostridium ihumii]